MEIVKEQEIILVGGFEETIELCELCKYKIVGIVDPEAKDWRYRYLGDDKTILEQADKWNIYPVVIAMDNPWIRKKVMSLYQTKGFKLASLISPYAYISPTAKIGEGCLIQSFCNISTNVYLGNGVKINTYANVMHDSILCDCVTVAPNAVILGSVNIHECSYIGANATIIQTKIIERGSVVGAGAVVTKNVDENTTVIGVPARKME